MGEFLGCSSEPNQAITKFTTKLTSKLNTTTLSPFQTKTEVTTYRANETNEKRTDQMEQTTQISKMVDKTIEPVEGKDDQLKDPSSAAGLIIICFAIMFLLAVLVGCLILTYKRSKFI